MRRSALALLAAAGLGACGSAPAPRDPAPRRASHPAVSPPSGAQDIARPAPKPRRPHPARRPKNVNGKPPPAHPVPASFQGVSPGAPSDAEVRAELAQMYRVQRRERALSAAAANLAGLLPWELEPKSGRHVSVASVFRDYYYGLACGGVLLPDQIGVAHKTAPCGTMIAFTYNGRTLRVPVIDRGPYIVGREWDLTGAAADALGFPGLGPIRWSLSA
jgi:hypothetical protein